LFGRAAFLRHRNHPGRGAAFGPRKCGFAGLDFGGAGQRLHLIASLGLVPVDRTLLTAI
jgi:hypothetical protein